MLQGDKSEIHFSLSKFAAETQNCSRGGVSSHRSPMLNLSWIHIRFTPKCNQHVDIRVNKQRFDWIGLCSVLCPRQHSVIWETVFLQHTAPSSVTLVRQLHRSKREFTWSDITSGLTSCMSYNVSKKTHQPIFLPKGHQNWSSYFWAIPFQKLVHFWYTVYEHTQYRCR